MAGDKSQWLPPRPEKVEDIRFFQIDPPSETSTMAEITSPARGDIITDVGPEPDTTPRETITGAPRRLDAPSGLSNRQPAPPTLVAEPQAFPGDQLSRLEDKTARIEEKLARSEAATQRVIDRFELASVRMGEVALQSDLVAVREDVVRIGRGVKGLPGFTALILTSLVTALLTAVIFIAILKYMPALLGR